MFKRWRRQPQDRPFSGGHRLAAIMADATIHSVKMQQQQHEKEEKKGECVKLLVATSTVHGVDAVKGLRTRTCVSKRVAVLFSSMALLGAGESAGAR